MLVPENNVSAVHIALNVQAFSAVRIHDGLVLDLPLLVFAIVHRPLDDIDTITAVSSTNVQAFSGILAYDVLPLPVPYLIIAPVLLPRNYTGTNIPTSPGDIECFFVHWIYDHEKTRLWRYHT